MGAISIDDMVTDCKLRFAIRLSTSFWTARLNEAYRFVCQQGSFPWALVTSTVTVASDGTFPVPSDFSPGKDAFLYKDAVLVEYLPYDRAKTHGDYGIGAATYSCWTYYSNLSGAPGSYGYTGLVFPENARPSTTDSATLVYHTGIPTPLTSGTQYFPSPPEFDSLIMELAESEARRRYDNSGFEIVQKRAQAQLVLMMQNYRTTKDTALGVVEQTLRVQDDQAEKA